LNIIVAQSERAWCQFAGENASIYLSKEP